MAPRFSAVRSTSIYQHHVVGGHSVSNYDFVRIAVLLLLSRIPSVRGLAPPFFDDYETLAVYRKHNNISYGYKTKHLPSEHCQYLTEQVCLQDDEAHGDYLKFVKRHRKRRILNPSIMEDNKIFHVPVLLVRFSDHAALNLPPKQYWETLFNGDAGEGPNEVGSISSYLYYSSLGKYKVVFDIFDWSTTNNTEAFYAEGKRGLVGNRKLQAMFTPVLDQLDAEGVDWSRFDLASGQPWDEHDNWPSGSDKIMDHIMVIHSGYGAEFGDESGCDPPLPNKDDRIWSQGSGSLVNPWESKRTGHMIGGYSVSSAFGLPRCGGIPSRMAVITHEYLHGFGLIDLYDSDKDETSWNGGGGIGKFGMMADLTGFGYNLAVPGHMSPSSRRDAEWLDFIEITQDGVYAASPSEVSSHVYRISMGFADGEYLLIENRQQMLWDLEMPSSGLIIWRVDETKTRQNERSWPGHPGWPEEHYRVSVVQADGLFEIEQNINRGEPNDFWNAPNVMLGPGPDMQPNTDSFYNGPTNIQITVLTSSSYVMLFRVTGLSRSRN